MEELAQLHLGLAQFHVTLPPGEEFGFVLAADAQARHQCAALPLRVSNCNLNELC